GHRKLPARPGRQRRVLPVARAWRAAGRGGRHRARRGRGTAMTRGKGRAILLVVHTGRRAAVGAARELANRLAAAAVGVHVLEAEAGSLNCEGVTVVGPGESLAGVELVVALGGDGTLLRAAELSRPAGVPLLGVNLGHVGFLAEVDRSDLETTVERILASTYDVEERMTLDVVIIRNGVETDRDWALNDVTIEKASRERMLDVV